MSLRLFLKNRFRDRGVPTELGNTQSCDENVFRVDDPHTEPHVLCVKKWRTTWRVKISLNIRFVDERKYNEVSVPNTSGGRRKKKNRPSWFHLEDRSVDYLSSESESSRDSTI